MRAKKRTSSRGLLSRLRGAFTENLGLKAICLSFALLLVAYQRSQEDEKTRTVAFSIDAQLPPDESSRELMTTIPPSVKVTVQGSSRALEQLSMSTTTLELDLRSGTTERVEFKPEQFELPPGTSIRFIEPATLKLEWQNIITRRVPIQSSVTGLVSAGYEVSKLEIAPDQVELRGPASLVGVTQFVRVAPFDVTGLSSGQFKRQLALDPPPNRTEYVGRSSAAVTVNVQRRLIRASFARVPVEVVGIPGAKTTPPSVDVTVRGEPEVIKALQRELVVPRVDATNLDTQRHGSKVLEVTVDLSRAEAEIQPPTVKVRW